MKKILAFFLGITLVIPAFLTPIMVLAASSAVKFQIEAPTTAKVGEAIDVTIRAVDKDGQIATDYRGSILFDTDWIGNTVPSPNKTITFTEEDKGEKKFSKGVIFKKAGQDRILVADVSPSSDIVGEAKVLVEDAGNSGNTANEEIAIVTPTQDSQITGNIVSVSGKTRKNSTVTLELNGKNVGTVISDESGLFTKEIADITQENNILKASILDSENKVIGTSAEIKFAKAKNESSIYGLSIQPGTTVEASSDITLTVDAIKGLAEVNITLDGALLKTKETSDGKYVVTTKAPQKEGKYDISVTSKSLTNQSSTRDKIVTLTVEAKKEEKKDETPTEMPKPAFKNVKTETKDSTVYFTFSVENAPQDLSTFKITYGSTGAVVTQTTDKILKNGVYSWYIPDLLPQDYTFKIYGQNINGGLIEWLESDSLIATVGVKSCTISNVGKISVTTDASKSTLTWDPVQNATAYNVYRIESDGKYSLIQKVTEPKYTLYLSRGAIEYKNFAVKALCGDNTESQDYATASRVQTGPGMIAFIVIVSTIIAGVILRRRSV